MNPVVNPGAPIRPQNWVTMRAAPVTTLLATVRADLSMARIMDPIDRLFTSPGKE